MQSLSHRDLHVAIIMDGNGRWAAQRGMPRATGHRAGLAAARRIVEHASDIGLRSLTLYAFSSDNWKRPPAEVQSIWWLLRAFLRLEGDRMRRRGARLHVIGRRDRLPQAALGEIEKTEALTQSGRGLHLRVAIDYSSRDAIARAALAAATSTAEQPTSPDALRSMLSGALTRDCGEVDLLIRTGGERRLSDFLLWESAYAELYFTSCFWPDFTEAEFDAALADFYRRDRRFGTVQPPLAIHHAQTELPRIDAVPSPEEAVR